MRGGWNKGLTKENNNSVRRTSETMRRKKLDNFKKWREEAKRNGKIKSTYLALEKNGDLAELIGVVLGDGHLAKHARCESLRITGNAENLGFITRYSNLVEKVFKKKPTVSKMKGIRAVTITIYEKHISERLGISTGARAEYDYQLPEWINIDTKYQIRFLRGLYEAEGSECHHVLTSTHKLFFSNKNKTLLFLISKLVQQLGFRTNISTNKVQVSRKEEVQNLANLLEFRHYGS